VHRHFSHAEFNDDGYREFENEVKKFTGAGWEPQGGVSIEFLDTRNFSQQRIVVAQALVKQK
jgi:hypothetical protein